MRSIKDTTKIVPRMSAIDSLLFIAEEEPAFEFADVRFRGPYTAEHLGGDLNKVKEKMQTTGNVGVDCIPNSEVSISISGDYNPAKFRNDEINLGNKLLVKNCSSYYIVYFLNTEAEITAISFINHNYDALYMPLDLPTAVKFANVATILYNKISEGDKLPLVKIVQDE